MESLYFVPIEFMSPEYDSCVRLRDKLLRRPLQLEFTETQLEAEIDEFHFGVFDLENNLLGCLSFKPVNTTTLKMRQVAIDEEQQGKGIGTFIVMESEKWARANNYKHIELHARDTAVSFYSKLKYQKAGNMFVEVNIPHWAMRKSLFKNKKQ